MSRFIWAAHDVGLSSISQMLFAQALAKILDEVWFRGFGARARILRVKFNILCIVDRFGGRRIYRGLLPEFDEVLFFLAQKRVHECCRDSCKLFFHLQSCVRTAHRGSTSNDDIDRDFRSTYLTLPPYSLVSSIV